MIYKMKQMCIATQLMFFILLVTVFLQSCDYTVSPRELSGFDKEGESPAIVNCALNGITIEDGNHIFAFHEAQVPANHACISEKRICTKGVLSGSAKFATCTPGVAEKLCVVPPGQLYCVNGQNVCAVVDEQTLCEDLSGE